MGGGRRGFQGGGGEGEGGPKYLQVTLQKGPSGGRERRRRAKVSLAGSLEGGSSAEVPQVGGGGGPMYLQVGSVVLLGFCWGRHGSAGGDVISYYRYFEYFEV